MKKLPPIEKVYEAWSAIADDRVSFVDDDRATVTSSDRSKTYAVRYDPVTDTYFSDDNATYWQGYPGYPVIAFMMLRRVLPLDHGFARHWGDVNWTRLNADFKRDYAAAVAYVAAERDIDTCDAARRARAVIDALASLPASVKRLRGA